MLFRVNQFPAAIGNRLWLYLGENDGKVLYAMLQPCIRHHANVTQSHNINLPWNNAQNPMNRVCSAWHA